MYFDFNVTGPERKRLVQAISEFTGTAARYLGAPTFAYAVDRFNISKDGVVSIEDGVDREVLDGLMEKLVNDGFVSLVSDCGCEEAPQEGAEAPLVENPVTVEAMPAEETESPQEAPVAPQEAVSPEVVSQPPEAEKALREAAVGETCGFCVELPREGVTDAALENLRKLVDSKAALIRKALGADRLDIAVTDERISFPWFDAVPDAEMSTAAAKFIGRLLDTARTQKRVTAREKPVENEKFAFRCFLLKLGFIGPEFKADRKVLLRNLTGSAAFRDGDRRGRESTAG